MKKTTKAILLIFSAGMALTFASCKGRTTDTVEPDGDTVEVIINTVGNEPDSYSDSIVPETEQVLPDPIK